MVNLADDERCELPLTQAELADTLGLSTVHGIVGQSGGRVDVDSAPGHGATFSVRLPRVALPVSWAAATLID